MLAGRRVRHGPVEHGGNTVPWRTVPHRNAMACRPAGGSSLGGMVRCVAWKNAVDVVNWFGEVPRALTGRHVVVGTRICASAACPNAVRSDE
jgi:hypothetical protein